MSLRINHASHPLLPLPRFGRSIPMDPASGPTERFDAGVINALLNTRAPAGGVSFDGTSGAKIKCALTGQNIGTDAFSLEFGLEIPTTVPASARGIFFLADNSTTNNVARCFMAEWRNNAGGRVEINLLGATTADYRRLGINNLITNFPGERARIAIVRSGATLTLYINGSVYTDTSETVSVGSPPAWSDTVTSSHLVIGNNSFVSEVLVGGVYGFTIYNLALSAADVLEIYKLGGAVPGWARWGSQVAKVMSDFSAGVNNWGTDDIGVSRSLTGNIDADADAAGVPPSNDWLKVARLTNGGTLYAYSAPWNNYSPGVTSNVLRGTKIRVRCDIFVPAGSTATHVRVESTGLASDVAFTPITPGSVTSINVTYTHTSHAIPRCQIGLNTGGTGGTNYNTGEKFYIKNLTGFVLGAEVHLPLNDGIGYQLHDESTNKLDALMTTTGISHLIPQRRGYVRGTLSWAGSHEAKSLLGQRALPPGAVPVLLTRKPTASSTGSGCTIGTTNTAARWQAAAAMAANTKAVAALANQTPAASADADHDILVDPDTNNYTGSIEVEMHYAVTEGTP